MSSVTGALRKHKYLCLLALTVILIAAAVLSLSLGRYSMDWVALASQLPLLWELGPDAALEASTALSVFFTMRLPRILIAALIGAGLAGAGAAFQGIFKNPMASPDLLGASAGAGFGAAVAILLGGGAALLEISAFAFGVVAVVCAYTLSRVIGRSMSGVLTLILSGMVIANLFQALISAAKYMADPNSTLPEITFWLMGGLSRATLDNLPWLVIAFAVGCIGLMALRWRINVLALGDEEAMALGVNVSLSRRLVIAFATLLTSAATAVAGMVGWVGLIIPHLARAIVGSDNRYVIPASMLLGGTFLLLVDDLCRSLYTTEVPLSILTSIIGVPLFIYLISRMRGGAHHGR